VVILVQVSHDTQDSTSCCVIIMRQVMRGYGGAEMMRFLLIMTLFIGMRSIRWVQQLRRYRSIRFAFKARITGLERVYRRAVIKRLSGTQSLEIHQCSNR
jgi:uncharacterized membrane protein YjgN (DUF898 family)